MVWQTCCVVSWSFLVASVVGALFTFNAYRPVRRNRVLYVPSFFASWLTIELAWVHVVWQLAATGLFVWAGALERWPGWVGLGLCVVSWVALGASVVASRATAGVAERALQALGADPVAPEPRQKTKVVRGVEFSRVAGRTLRLDVRMPAGPPPEGVRRPALLQVHGGAWIIGFKRDQARPLLKLMASHGWVTFNVDYRLSPGATWPDHLVDVKAALAWIREHADEYHVDPGFVAVTGGSAGGHLTAMMALTQGEAEYQQGFEDADTSVQAAVPLYGVYDFTNRQGTMDPEFISWVLEPLVMKRFLADEPEAFSSASPIDRVREDAPPTMVVHGDRDTLAPVEDARLFVERLADVSKAPVLYCELHGAQHAFDTFGSIRTRRAVRAVHRFLCVVHDRYRRGEEAEEMDISEESMPDEVVAVDDPGDVERASRS